MSVIKGIEISDGVYMLKITDEDKCDLEIKVILDALEDFVSAIDSEKVILASEYEQAKQILQSYGRLSHLNIQNQRPKEQRYMKCIHMNKNCKWRMANNHSDGYDYLNNSCYLAGFSELECPE